MSAPTAIERVGRSLKKLLEAKINGIKVTFQSPDGNTNLPRINLFLYKIEEKQFFKNLDWQAKAGDPTKAVPPPLSLNLFYLMTAYAPPQDDNGDLAAHEILGRAMQIFFENQIVEKDYLEDELKQATEQIKVMLTPIDLNEMGHLWSTFSSQPFRLSVVYEVSVIQIDLLVERQIAEQTKQVDVQVNLKESS